ncbi:MAG TPA: hypothetical protein PLB52_03830 [Candidatus Moranbacteria bacterium]|nr:hypothetical protein [Candidatus Moranbacteria bacterium]
MTPSLAHGQILFPQKNFDNNPEITENILPKLEIKQQSVGVEPKLMQDNNSKNPFFSSIKNNFSLLQEKNIFKSKNNEEEVVEEKEEVVEEKKEEPEIAQKKVNQKIPQQKPVTDVKPKTSHEAIGLPGKIVVETKSVNGKRVCRDIKGDDPSKSKRNKKGHIDAECCLDKDETPNSKCYYPPEKYGKLIQKYLSNKKKT